MAVGNNVLPNTYIPVLPPGSITAILLKLPRQSLIDLFGKWPRIVNTQPPPQTSKTQRETNKLVLAECESFRLNKPNKKHVVERIIYYWPRGLNLLQLSQIDCQMIVDKPNSFSWIASVVKTSKGLDHPINLDPKSFLDLLSQDLTTFFMNHIYVCKHPNLPLIIVRIQVFDLESASLSRSSSRPHITSNRAYFVAIPLGSAYIIHSPGNLLVTDIIMQVVERNLPQENQNLLTLVTDKKQRPVKSLDSMQTLYGISRFGNSLGAWILYADNSVDISPIGPIEDHKSVKSLEDHSNLSIKEIANVRFRGSKDGQINLEKLHEDHLVFDNRKRRKKNTHQLDEFGSLAPMQYAEFLLKRNNDGRQTSITLKFTGSDVFAGLHELSVQTTDESKMIVNPKKMPSWLTGEEGRSCGTVKDGIFLHN